MNSILLLLVWIGSGLGCSSKPHHHIIYKNRKRPILFSYSPDIEKSGQFCKDRSEDSEECHLVDVNLEAFLAPEMTVALSASETITNSVDSSKQRTIILSKRTQEGLDLITKNKKSAGTATVSYKSEGGSVVFVIKASHVFGSITDSDGNIYGLEPCLGRENCHLWLKRKPEQKQSD